MCRIFLGDTAGIWIIEPIAQVEEAARARELGDLRALAGVSKFPVRVKCALLGWNALQEALKPSESR